MFCRLRVWEQLVPRVGTDAATTTTTTYTRRPTPGAQHAAPWFGVNRRRSNSAYCRHCGRQFASVSMLRSHAEKVHGLVIGLPVTRGSHTCHVCGKTFVELPYLRQHMEKHGEERFVCEKCGQRSRWASNMVRHRKKCKFTPASALK